MSNLDETLEFADGPCYTACMGLTEYIDAAMATARIKNLADRTYFGEIPGFRGVWGNAKTVKKCREELRGALESWLVLKLRCGDSLPAVRGKRLALPVMSRA